MMNDLRDRLGDHAFRYYDLWQLIKKNWQDSIMITLAIILLVASAVLFFSNDMPKERMYDCSISEISPDYPIEVKEACRKIRAQQSQKP
jgi:hypothetical protein